MKPLVVGFQEEDESKDHSHHRLYRKEKSFEGLILLCTLYKGAFLSKSSPVKQIPWEHSISNYHRLSKASMTPLKSWKESEWGHFPLMTWELMSAVISNNRTETKENRNCDVTMIHVLGPLSLHWAQWESLNPHSKTSILEGWWVNRTQVIHSYPAIH